MRTRFVALAVTLALLTLGSGCLDDPDPDRDGLRSAVDNCRRVANPSQIDLDADGIGNACDCDFDQNGVCGASDFAIGFTESGCFGKTVGPGAGPPDDPFCAESDMDANGAVGYPDFDLFLARYGMAPGPGIQPIAFQLAGAGGGGAIWRPTVHPTDPNTVYVGTDVGGLYRSRDGGASWQPINRGIAVNRGSGWFHYNLPAVAIRPDLPDHVYVAGSTRGVFRSTDGGDSFELIADESDGVVRRNGLSINAFAFDPADPTTMYLVQGEPDHRWLAPTSYAQGPTVLKSTDAGATWTSASSGIPVTAEGRSIVTIPGVPASVMASTSEGVFFSDDAGASWTERSVGLPSDGNRFGVLDVFTFPGGASLIFVSVETVATAAGGYSGGIYFSLDQGLGWIDATEPLPLVDSLGRELDYFALASAGSGSTFFLLAGAARQSVGGGEVRWWRTANTLTSWLPIESGEIELGWLPWQFNAWGIAVAPSDPNVVYLSSDRGLFRSNDAGAHWSQIYSTLVSGAPGTGEGIEGFWRTRGLEETWPHQLVFHPSDPAKLYAAWEDLRVLRSFDGGASWDPVHPDYDVSSDANALVLDPGDDDVLYLASGSGNGDGGMAKSSDRGADFVALSSASATVPTERNPKETRQHLLLDPASPIDSRHLLLTTWGKGVYESQDGGATWLPASDGLPAAGVPYAGMLRRFGDDVYLLLEPSALASDDAGGVYATTSFRPGATLHWSLLNQTTELAHPIAIARHPTDANVLFVGTLDHRRASDGAIAQGGLWKSADGGSSFVRVLDYPQIEDVAFDPTDPDVLYAAAPDEVWTWQHSQDPTGAFYRAGLYRSTDGGDTWHFLPSDVDRICLRTKWLAFSPHAPRELWMGGFCALTRAMLPALH